MSGPPNLKGKASLGEILEFDLTEALDEEGKGTGVYRASLRLPEDFWCPATALSYHFADPNGTQAGEIKESSQTKVEVWEKQRVQVGETKEPNSAFTYGLHEVRLGGPYITELPAGVRFEIVGKQGNQIKARLTDNLTGWINESQVTILPDGTPPPHHFFTALRQR